MWVRPISNTQLDRNWTNSRYQLHQTCQADWVGLCRPPCPYWLMEGPPSPSTFPHSRPPPYPHPPNFIWVPSAQLRTLFCSNEFVYLNAGQTHHLASRKVTPNLHRVQSKNVYNATDRKNPSFIWSIYVSIKKILSSCSRHIFAWHGQCARQLACRVQRCGVADQ